jgi:hypothetical protein
MLDFKGLQVSAEFSAHLAAVNFQTCADVAPKDAS